MQLCQYCTTGATAHYAWCWQGSRWRVSILQGDRIGRGHYSVHYTLSTHCRWWYVTGWYLQIAECGAAWGLAPGDTGQCWEQCLVSVRRPSLLPATPGVMMSSSAVMGDNFILSGRGDDKLIQVSHFPTNFASRSNLTTPFSKITSLTLSLYYFIYLWFMIS